MRLPKRIMIATIAVFILTLPVALPVAAQSPEIITAQVDRTSLTTDDYLLLTVSVNAQSSAGQPTLPSLDGFEITGTSSSQQISIINGVASAHTNYLFRLRPTRAGDLSIGPVTTVADGQSHSTEPIAITVSQGTGNPQPAQPSPPLAPGLGFRPMPGLPGGSAFPPLNGDPFNMDPWDLLNQLQQWDPFGAPAAGLQQQPGQIEAPTDLSGQDFFVEAGIDNPTPYQGEQIVYTVRLYQAVETLGRIDYQAPGLTGFWSSQSPEQSQYTTQAAGRTYRVTELRTVLFPTVVGEVTIDPAQVNIPGGFFGSSRALQTQPLSLDVQPLPPDAPADFQGAVGRFAIQAEVDAAQAQVNDAITRRVTIAGQGNVDTMGDPTWPESSQWRAFDSEARTETRLKDGQLGGIRTYEQILVPTTAGDLILPAISYSYFDPDTGVYETVSTDPITVSVTADERAQVLPDPAAVGLQQGMAAHVSVQQRLAALKPAPATWSANVPLTQRPGYWLLWMVPLVLIGGQVAWGRRRRYLEATLSQRRSQQAARQAHQAIRETQARLVDGNIAAGRILTGYLGAKLSRSVSGMTNGELSSLLLNRGISREQVAQVVSLLSASEASRYAPADSSSADDDLLESADRLIDELDAAF